MVGGGNTAVEEALFLTNFAAKVYLIHRRDSLRADKVNQARLFANPKVEPIWDATVAEVLGSGSPETVRGVRLDIINQPPREIAIDGLFIAIGHTPATGLFEGALAMDAEGYLLTAPRQHRHQHPRRIRGRRREGQAFPPGGDGGGHGLHGRARGRTLAGAPRRPFPGGRGRLMPVDWAKLRLFDCVAEAGSFTEGARRLHMSQPALSRQIAGLEESLGAKLFHRHARGLVLTHEGEQLHDSTREVSDRIERTMMGIEASRARPTGEVRLATTVSFGSTWLVRQMGEFLALYPDITVQLVLADEETDLARREADCAIRFHAPHQSDLVRKALTPVNYRICGSPDYLERFGEPQTMDDLARHRIVAYGPSAPSLIRGVNWLSDPGEGAGAHVPVLTVNNIFASSRLSRPAWGWRCFPTT